MSKGTGSGIVKPPAGLTAAGVPTVAAAKAAAAPTSTLDSVGKIQLKDITNAPPKIAAVTVQAPPATTVAAAASSSPTGSIQGNAAAISQKYIKEATQPHYPLTKQSEKLTKSLSFNKKEQEIFAKGIAAKQAEIDKRPSNVDQLQKEMSSLLVAQAISKAVGVHISDKKKKIDKALAQIDKANKKGIHVDKGPKIDKKAAVEGVQHALNLIAKGKEKAFSKEASAKNLLKALQNLGGVYKQGVWVPVGTNGPGYTAATDLVKKDIAKYSTQATKDAAKSFQKDKIKGAKIHEKLTKVTAEIQTLTNSQGINTANKGNQTKLKKLTTQAQALFNQISSLQSGTASAIPTSVLNAINQAEAAIIKKGEGYKTHADSYAADKALEHLYVNVNATDAELSAVRSYTANGYTHINSKLRAADGDSYAKKSDHVKSLDSLIKKAPLTPYDMKVRRDFSFGPMFTHLEKYGTLNGTVMTDRGFSSTSARMNWGWSGGFKATILLPKGSQGMYTGGNSNFSSNDGESELILPRGTRYKIISTKKNYGNTELVMEAYTPNHPKYHTIKPGFGHKGDEY